MQVSVGYFLYIEAKEIWAHIRVKLNFEKSLLIINSNKHQIFAKILIAIKLYPNFTRNKLEKRRMLAPLIVEGLGFIALQNRLSFGLFCLRPKKMTGDLLLVVRLSPGHFRPKFPNKPHN